MVNQNPRLPIFAALSAFVLYAATMGDSVTLNSLSLVTTLAGWNDSVMVGQPVLWLLTLPFRLLPAAWMPFLVKLLAAGMGASVVGLLARSVQLLPWDHPWDKINRSAAAVPVVAACVLCGLEFNFWQESTSTCGELMDLLLLAAGMWLLMEYNVRGKPQWLDAAALVWGVGMAENWLMVLTLPLFVIGIIWIERLRFFRWSLVLRLAVLGLIGFSVYLLLPMVNGLAPHSPLTLRQSWVASLAQTYNQDRLLYYQFWKTHRLLLVGVVVYFLVPTIPLLIRMRDEGMQNKLSADRFQILLYRLLRIGLLLACCWLAFDPAPGARQLLREQLNRGFPMLTLDYVTGLGAAFLLGNLMLVGLYVVYDEYNRFRGTTLWQTAARPAAVAATALLAAALLFRNTPAIIRLNFNPLEQYGALAVASLPPGHGVVLSDFQDRLDVFMAALARSPAAADWLPVDTHALASPKYRARLERRRPDGWITDATRHELSPAETVRLLEQISRKNQLCYLHPSYGYFFEAFYLEPAGAIYNLKPRGKDPLLVPPAPAGQIDANEKFWTAVWDRQLAGLAPPPRRPAGLRKSLARFGLTPAPLYQDSLLAQWYSIPIDAWAVDLQTLGRLADAKVRFEQALQLNSNNISARFSLMCNTNLQNKKPMGLSEVSALANQLGNPDHIDFLRGNDGPFDEPDMNYVEATVFLSHDFLVQAADRFERTRTLVPGAPAAELALAEIYNRLQMSARSRPLIDHIREQTQNLTNNAALDLNLALVDSYAWLLQSNVSQARSVLRAVAAKHPGNPQFTTRIVAAYLAFGDVADSGPLADAQLARTPDDITALNDKAVILLHSGRPADAVPLFSHVLTITNQPSVRLNRAFASIAATNLTAAESDLHLLEHTKESPGLVNFGLAIVAHDRQDTNSTVEYLRLCLTNTPVSTPLWQQAATFLHSLQPAPAAK